MVLSVVAPTLQQRMSLLCLSQNPSFKHTYIHSNHVYSGPIGSPPISHMLTYTNVGNKCRFKKKKIFKCIIPPSILYEAQNQARKLQHLIDKTNEGRLHLCRLHHALNCSASFSLHFIPLQHMEQRPIRCPFCVDSDDTHPGRCTIWCCHGGRKSAR